MSRKTSVLVQSLASGFLSLPVPFFSKRDVLDGLNEHSKPSEVPEVLTAEDTGTTSR